MAIQLNERDELIFNLIEEHQVLLEKHIAWFISTESKPVLIRDRLRKLFYLDYLLCQRHRDTLPWWTTPTKPLVYTLSPMTRGIVGLGDMEMDVNDHDIQRHLLEVANLRMLFHVAQTDGQIANFEWTTCNREKQSKNMDARVTFTRGSTTYDVAILNNPNLDAAALSQRIEGALDHDGVEMVWIVSRDEAQQRVTEKMVAANGTISNHVFFGTHQDLYKAGIVKCNWENSHAHLSAMFLESVQESKCWTGGFRPAVGTA
jgi:hypothetical protein